jgi:hypothetical protein
MADMASNGFIKEPDSLKQVGLLYGTLRAVDLVGTQIHGLCTMTCLDSGRS